MEPGTLLLIGLLATLIILIILHVRRSKREREEREWRASATARKTSTGYSAPAPVPSAPAVKVRMAYGTKPAAMPRRQPVTPQVTLYQLPVSAGKLICPGCEGENDVRYSFCLICGQRIR